MILMLQVKLKLIKSHQRIGISSKKAAQMISHLN